MLSLGLEWARAQRPVTAAPLTIARAEQREADTATVDSKGRPPGKNTCGATCPVCKEDKAAEDLNASANCRHFICWKCYGMAYKCGRPIEACPVCRAEFHDESDDDSDVAAVRALVRLVAAAEMERFLRHLASESDSEADEPDAVGVHRAGEE